MTTSACNGTKITITNSNVTYPDGENQDLMITAAGPQGSRGGALTDSDGNNPPAVPVTLAYGGSVVFTADSSDGSNGDFNGEIDVRCNAATSPTDDTDYEIVKLTISGECSIIHSSNCTAMGATTASDHFTATSANSSPTKENENYINFSVMNS